MQILQSRMHLNLELQITGFSNMVDTGSDRAPVAGARRGHHSCAGAGQRGEGQSGTQLTLELNTHVLGNERPSVINELVILYM